MGVVASARDKLGGVWERVKGWARSVPPDVWIGLAIAAATLIVVYLAYKQSKSSSGTGLSTSDPIIGTSNTPGTTPLTSQDVLGTGSGLGALDLTQLWSDPNRGKGGPPPPPQKPYGIDESPIIGVARADIIKSATTQDESSLVAKIQKAFLAPPPVVNTGYVVPFATTRDESLTAAFSSNMSSAYPTVSTAGAVSSATLPNQDESTIAKIIQAVTQPKAQPKPAPVRVNPFVSTVTTQSGTQAFTGRGTSVVY